MSDQSGALMRPGDAAKAVGIKPSTLRVYAQRFAHLLSDDATAAERPGYRLYTPHDVAVLRQARELLERGFTYERAAASIRGAGSARGTAPATAALPRGEWQATNTRTVAAEPSSGVLDQIQALREALQAWKALADERAAEIASLRDEVRHLRELVVTARRPEPRQRLRHR